MPTAAQRRFLREVCSPLLVVVLGLFGLFVTSAFLEQSVPGRLVLSVAFCAVMLLAIHASGVRIAARRAALAAALLVPLLRFPIARGIAPLWIVVAEHFLFWGLTLLGLVALLRMVLRAKRVDPDEIYAAVAAYLLLALFWAVAFSFLSNLALDPPAFSGLAPPDPAYAYGSRLQEMIYYSCVTLTTLGFGDITPTHPITRNLSAFEAITGQLFIAVLLARLVAMSVAEAASRRERRE